MTFQKVVGYVTNEQEIKLLKVDDIIADESLVDNFGRFYMITNNEKRRAVAISQDKYLIHQIGAGVELWLDFHLLGSTDLFRDMNFERKLDRALAEIGVHYA